MELLQKIQPMEPTHLAKLAYESYCDHVNWQSVSGEKLPTWNDLKKDSSKEHIVLAWMAATQAVRKEIIANVENILL